MGTTSSKNTSSSSSSSTPSSSSSPSSPNKGIDEAQRAANEAAAATLALPWSPNKLGAEARQTFYAVQPGDNLYGIETSACFLVVSVESLRLHRADNKALLLQFPYHKIVCWGYNDQEFQWRCFKGDDEESETIVSKQ